MLNLNILEIRLKINQISKNAIEDEWVRGNKAVAAKLYEQYKQDSLMGKYNPAKC